MGQASNELRELMRQNLFNELSSFFTNEEEGRRISAQMEDKFFQNSKSQEEYLTAFMKHLEQLKTLKQEAQAQSMAAVQSNPPPPPPPEPKKPPTASLPATIVPAIADPRSRSAEIFDYLTQCQKKISPAVLESIVDPRQKAFFELLIKEIHSVRTALEQGMPPTHPELGPRIKNIVDKVRAINKSQQLHMQQQQNLRQQIQQRHPAAAIATTAQMSRQVSVAQAVPDALASSTANNKRKRKPSGSGDGRRLTTQKQAKSVSAPSTPAMPSTPYPSILPAAALNKPTTKSDLVDQSSVVPGINGFFEQIAKFDKKPKMNQLKQSSIRIMSMLQYIRTREGFEAAELARRASIRKNQPARPASAPVTPPTPMPTATPNSKPNDGLLESVMGQNLLVAESSASVTDPSIPDPAQPPFQRELDQVQSSGLFTITTLPRKHPSWCLLRFDLNFSNISVPSLLVGIRNDYNEQECVSSCASGPSSCLDRIDYRAQKGNSSLTDQNILQIDALLRKCMLQRKPCLYDLVCTWHRAIKHVFSTDHPPQTTI